MVRVGALGDVLHALAAVTALKRARPQWEIGWVVEPRWRALLETDDGERPVVDRIHLARTRDWKRRPVSATTVSSISELRAELRGRRYEVCLDMQGSVRSSVIGWMAGARRYVGMDEPREGLARWLYPETVEVRSKHVVEQGFELMEAVLGEELPFSGTGLPVDRTAERWADDVMAEAGGEVVFLSPTAGWGAKQWPAERYGEVARALRGAGYRVLVNAAGNDEELPREVERASGGAARRVGSTLPEMIALLRRVRLVIAGDTGPLHLAAALRTPVVGLYGPTDPARTGPFETAARVLRDPASVTDHRRHPETEAGLLRIGVRDVLKAATELLSETQGVGLPAAASGGGR